MKRLLLVIALLPAGAWADFMDHFVVREDIGPHKIPYLGKAEVVVLPVEVAGFPPIDRAALEKFFGPDDPAGFTAFYRTASLGRYQPHVTVAQTIKFDTCPLPVDQFPKCSVTRGDFAALSAGIDLIREVVKRARDQGTDFSKFDVNGRKGGPDGYADGVMLLGNLPFGGIALPFSYFNRDDNLNGGTGGPLIVNGIKIPHVAIAGSSAQRVMVHEFGHLLGLTDLYDESDTYDGLHLTWMGAWGYNANIPLPDAETRFRLRWADWHQVEGKQKVVIAPAETTGEVWRLGTGDEYFLVENRGPRGAFDRDLNVRGLAVFHVDRKLPQLGGEEGMFVQRTLNCVNCDPWHPYIMWVQADGKFQVQTNGKPEWATDLFADGDSLVPESSGLPLSATHKVLSTNWYSGQSSGITIDEIKVRLDQSIEVTFEAPATAQCGDRLCDQGDGCAPTTCTTSSVAGGGGGCAAAPGLLAALALAGLLRRRELSAS